MSSHIRSEGFAIYILFIIVLWVLVQLLASHGFFLRHLDHSLGFSNFWLFSVRGGMLPGSMSWTPPQKKHSRYNPRSSATTLRCNLGAVALPGMRTDYKASRCLFCTRTHSCHCVRYATRLEPREP